MSSVKTIAVMGQILALEKLRKIKALTVQHECSVSYKTSVQYSCCDTEGRSRKRVRVTDGVEKPGVYFSTL